MFLLFLILALLFSVLSKLSVRYTQTFTFKVKPIGVPESNVIISDTSNVMKITMTSFGFKQLKYHFIDPEIEIDFRDLNKTKTNYVWTKQNGFLGIARQFDANVSVENITPDTMLFRYDVNAVKMVPLALNSDITYTPGYDLVDEFQLTPDSIKVIGPKVLLDSIVEVKTEKLELEDINNNIQQDINLDLPDVTTKGVSFSEVKTLVTGNVERFTEGTISVPVNVVNVPSNIEINYYPKRIPVVFYTSLSNFKAISSSSFIVECDYNSLNQANTFLIPQIVQKPSQVKSAKLDVKRVEFILIR